MQSPKKCPITGKEMRHIFDHLVLGKYNVAYYYSDDSGIIQTEEPYWLEEAYRSVISHLDTRIAQRSFCNAQRLEPVLSLLFPDDSVFVDTACGYGLFTRLMRDIGFNFFGHDKFCENIFSKAFEPPPGTKATAICAFEVLEHLLNPVEFLAEQLRNVQSDTIIASTCVFDGHIPDSTWVYYSFESGQHLTFYQPRTLQLIARSLGCQYYLLGIDLHLITKRQIPAWQLFVLTNRLARKVHAMATRYARRHRSLILADYEFLRSRILNSDSHVSG
jgi:hypothetical protein